MRTSAPNRGERERGDTREVERPPELTIVIPAWDAYALEPLSQALESVGDQGESTRVVVVDNASTPAVSVEPPGEVVRSEVRVSRGAARNLGLARVQSPYVLFLDADDLLLPGALSNLLSGIRSNPDSVAYAMGIRFATGQKRLPLRLARVLVHLPSVFSLATVLWSLLPTQGSTILRSDVVRDAGGYADRDHGEDWVLAAAVARRGRVTFGRGEALLYRWHEGSPGRTPGTRDVLGGGRAVRRQLAADPRSPRWLRVMLPAVAVAQLLLVYVARPAVRARNRLGRSTQPPGSPTSL